MPSCRHAGTPSRPARRHARPAVTSTRWHARPARHGGRDAGTAPSEAAAQSPPSVPDHPERPPLSPPLHRGSRPAARQQCRRGRLPRAPEGADRGSARHRALKAPVEFLPIRLFKPEAIFPQRACGTGRRGISLPSRAVRRSASPRLPMPQPACSIRADGAIGMLDPGSLSCPGSLPCPGRWRQRHALSGPMAPSAECARAARGSHLRYVRRRTDGGGRAARGVQACSDQLRSHRSSRIRPAPIAPILF